MKRNRRVFVTGMARVMVAARATYAESFTSLLEALSPQYRQVYDVVASRGSAYSAEIRDACNISDSQASTMLYTLHQMGLLTRRLEYAPRRYVYRPSEVYRV